MGQSDSLGKYVLHRILSSLQIKQIVNTAERYLGTSTAEQGWKRLTSWDLCRIQQCMGIEMQGWLEQPLPPRAT